MHPYTYKVSLRIRHPTMDPQIFTETLGMQPWVARHAGEPRATSTSPWLEGNHRKTYWTSRLTPPDDSDIETFLVRTVKSLTPHRLLFRELRDTGGELELFIGLFASGGNIGATLPHDLMVAIGDMGIDLGLDIYDYEGITPP